MTSTSYAF
ncbi:hypothetical protein EC960109_4052A, partial [Escherichia coli 96.0109]